MLRFSDQIVGILFDMAFNGSHLTWSSFSYASRSKYAPKI